jgi:hypothetical protein
MAGTQLLLGCGDRPCLQSEQTVRIQIRTREDNDAWWQGTTLPTVVRLPLGSTEKIPGSHRRIQSTSPGGTLLRATWAYV